MPAPAQGVIPTTNYLVPSSGRTQAVLVEGTFSAQAYEIDWRQYNVDSDQGFQPQGVFIDNSLGLDTLTITIEPIGWEVTCAAGTRVTENFPAPNGQQAFITGNGDATIVFVNFPVLPSAGAVTIQGGSVEIGGQPISTVPSVNSGGVPYQTQEIPVTANNPIFNNSITGAVTTTGNMTPASVNQYLRKLELRLTGDVSLVAAGLNLITATLNGVPIWKASVYIPGAAPNVAQYWAETIDFTNDDIGLNFGAGSLVVTVSTALATGHLECNVYSG